MRSSAPDKWTVSLASAVQSNGAGCVIPAPTQVRGPNDTIVTGARPAGGPVADGQTSGPSRRSSRRRATSRRVPDRRGCEDIQLTAVASHPPASELIELRLVRGGRCGAHRVEERAAVGLGDDERTPPRFGRSRPPPSRSRRSRPRNRGCTKRRGQVGERERHRDIVDLHREGDRRAGDKRVHVGAAERVVADAHLHSDALARRRTKRESGTPAGPGIHVHWKRLRLPWHSR